MSTNLEYRERERHRKSIEKEKAGGTPAKFSEKKGDRDLEREMKNNGDNFLFGERHENFVTAATNAR